MLYFALIGCGRIATRHAENIKRVGKLVAVYDIDERKAKVFAATYNAHIYTSLQELLRSDLEINIIVICTPNGYHAQHCIAALQSGKNVLCEKPLCLTTADAKEIIRAEKTSGKKIFVVKSMRFNPLLKQLKEKMDSNELGQVFSFELSCFWHRPPEYYQNSWHGKCFPDGGTLFTQFSHYIDAMLWLFGNLKKVCGFSSNAFHKNVIEFEDTGATSLFFENGILGSFNWSVNTFQKNLGICLTVIAQNGTIVLGGEFLNEVVKLQLPQEINFEFKTSTFDRSTLSYHKEVYDNLVSVMNGEDLSFTSAQDGLRTIEAIESIYHSVSII